MASVREIVVTKQNAGQRAERFLKKYLNEAPLGFLYKLFRKKDVKANGHWIAKDYILQEGDVVRVYVSEEQLEDFKKPRAVKKAEFPYPIAYEDENVLIVNKPKGILVYGDKTGVRETLGNAVLDYLYLKGEYDPDDASFTPSPAHRIDRNTSGLVIYGKNNLALQELTALFKDRNEIEKRYLALVLGDLSQNGEIAKPLWKDANNGRVYVKPIEKGGKMALTRYTVKQRFGEYTLVEAELVTGRTHQIRVHFASIGHPLVGDEKYGDFASCRFVKKATGLESQLLHAYSVTFLDVGGVLSNLAHKTVRADLPADYVKIIETLTGMKPKY